MNRVLKGALQGAAGAKFRIDPADVIVQPPRGIAIPTEWGDRMYQWHFDKTSGFTFDLLVQPRTMVKAQLQTIKRIVGDTARDRGYTLIYDTTRAAAPELVDYSVMIDNGTNDHSMGPSNILSIMFDWYRRPGDACGEWSVTLDPMYPNQEECGAVAGRWRGAFLRTLAKHLRGPPWLTGVAKTLRGAKL